MAPLALGSVHIVNTTCTEVAVTLGDDITIRCDGNSNTHLNVSAIRSLSVTATDVNDIELKQPRIQVHSRPLRYGRRRIAVTEHAVTEHAKVLVYHQKVARLQDVITIVARPNLSSWMASLSGSVSLDKLYLPGTHESLAFFGGPISTCQSLKHTLYEQLRAGIRFVDLRFSLKDDGKLHAYHGIQNEYAMADDVMQQLYRFLDENPRETVIVSIKQENATLYFEDVLWRLLDERPEYWYKENRWPTLGEVRGRAIVMCRFGFTSGQGLHPIRWPNNAPKPFETQLGEKPCIMQDWYAIGSFVRIPEKALLALSLFRRPRDSTPKSALPVAPSPLVRPGYEPPTPLPFRVSFTSGASLLTAFPSTVAKGFGLPRYMLGFPGVNARVLEGLLAITRHGGEGRKADECGAVLVMDFFEAPGGLVELLVAWNFMPT